MLHWLRPVAADGSRTACPDVTAFQNAIRVRCGENSLFTAELI